MYLTPHNLGIVIPIMEGDRPHTPGPGAEIEITPEMIEAGASVVLNGISPSRLYAPMDEEKLATLVYRAMEAVRACAAKDRPHKS